MEGGRGWRWCGEVGVNEKSGGEGRLKVEWHGEKEECGEVAWWRWCGWR